MTEIDVEEKWISAEKLNPNAKLRLFCFPYGGASANMFRDWYKFLDDQVEILPLQFPGRWNRLDEAPVTKADDIVLALDSTLSKYLDRPFLFLGCCAGSLIAYDWVRKLRARGGPVPNNFYSVAAFPPQRVFKVSEGEVYKLSDQKLLEVYGPLFQTMGHNVSEMDTDFIETVLPALRGDTEYFQTYKYVPEENLNIKITTMGSRTDPFTPIDELVKWYELTNIGFSLDFFEGNHYFPFAQKEKFLSCLNRHLRNDLRGLQTEKG